jgi:uncharacterized damage-inducible protein DinB
LQPVRFFLSYSMTSLIAANCSCLHQGVHVINELPDGLYADFHPASPEGSIGAHLRHCIDHYDCFLQGLGDGRIDYAKRERRLDLEQDPSTAVERLGALATELLSLQAEWDRDREVSVRAASVDGSDRGWLPSTLGRELQFLLSHTIHHFALIAMLLRLAGRTPPAEFGVAPSTLHYRQNLAACAR